MSSYHDGLCNLLINETTCPAGEVSTYGATATLALISTTDVNSVTWLIVGTSGSRLRLHEYADRHACDHRDVHHGRRPSKTKLNEEQAQ